MEACAQRKQLGGVIARDQGLGARVRGRLKAE